MGNKQVGVGGQTPGVGLHPRSYRICAGYAVILVVGMSLAAWLHDVPDGVSLTLSKSKEQFFVRADKAQIHQVILNAVLNAATTSDGSPARIELSLRRVIRDGENWVSVSIRALNPRPRLADTARWSNPFVATEQQPHRFGLTSARRSLEAVGGSIEMKQIDGNGFCVYLLLPLLRIIGPESGESADVGRLRGQILVVGDEVQVQDVLCARLKSWL